MKILPQAGTPVSPGSCNTSDHVLKGAARAAAQAFADYGEKLGWGDEPARLGYAQQLETALRPLDLPDQVAVLDEFGLRDHAAELDVWVPETWKTAAAVHMNIVRLVPVVGADGQFVRKTDGQISQHFVVQESISLPSALHLLRHDPTTRDRTARVRECEPGSVGYKRGKGGLVRLVPTLNLPPQTPLAGVTAGHNGMYHFDVDQRLEGLSDEELAALDDRLWAHPNVTMLAVSAGGVGRWVLIHGPLADDPEDYKAHNSAIIADLPDDLKRYFLDAQGHTSRTELNGQRYGAHDPNARLRDPLPPPHPRAGPAVEAQQVQAETTASDAEEPPPSNGQHQDAWKWDLSPEAHLERILARDGNFETTRHGHQAVRFRCPGPGHTNGDQTPSAEAWLGKDKQGTLRVALKCYAGCPDKDIRQGLDLPFGRRPGSAPAPPTAGGSCGAAGVTPGIAVWPGLPLTAENAQDDANFHRFIQDHAPSLVVALQHDEPETLADIYAVTRSGRLDRVRAQALLRETAYRILDANRVQNTALTEDGNLKLLENYKPVRDDARGLLKAGGFDKLRAVAQTVIDALKYSGKLPDGLVVVAKDDVDGNLRYFGSPNGVWDLLTGLRVNPREARQFFVAACIRDAVHPTATHDWVDAILPPLSALATDSIEMYRARIIAYVMTHRPNREFVLELCDAGSGKTACRNGLQYALRPYVSGVNVDCFLTNRFRATGGTAHNGYLFRFGPPARLLFMPEFGVKEGTHMDLELLNKATGGEAAVEARQISKKISDVAPTASLWIQGNKPKGGTDPLSIAKDDDDVSRGIRDRARVLHRDRIPDADQMDDYKDAGRDLPDFRQAVVARVMEYCVRWGRDRFPEDIPSVRDAQAAAIEDARPLFLKEFIPTIISREMPDVVPQPAHSHLVYQEYLAWNEANGEGKPQPQRAVTEAVQKHHELEPGRKGKLKGDIPGKRPETIFWDGWFLVPVDTR